MTRACAALLAFLAVPALAEDAEKPMDLFGRAVKNMNAADGYHLDAKIDVDMGGESMAGGSVDATVRNPDFAFFKIEIAGNALDVVKEEDRIAFLNPSTGKWEANTGNQTLDFFVKIFNLGSLLTQLRDTAADAEFGKEDNVGKRECRVVSFRVPKKSLEKLIASTESGSSLGVSAENAKMKLKTWIDKKEELPRRIQIVIDVEMSGLPGAPGEEEWGEGWEEEGGKKKEEGKKEGGDEEEEEVPPMKIGITVTSGIKNYDEDLEPDVPKEAKKVLEAQKTEKSGPEKKKDEEK
jgi:hypothetical protein